MRQWLADRGIDNLLFYFQKNLRYVSAINDSPGSGTGIRMLLEGELDFSQLSRPIEPQKHILAHQRGFVLKSYHVAIDAIAIKE